MPICNLIKTYAELGKFNITVAVSITTITGYLLYAGNFSPDMIWPVAGIFFLASGSSALNQV